jgi:hypothetical protein
MRLAAIAAREAGITLCAVAHDAFWIAAPLPGVVDAIGTMAQIMVRADRVVSGGIDIRVEVSADVRYPQRLGNARKSVAKGQAMWCEIRDLVGGVLKEHRA